MDLAALRWLCLLALVWPCSGWAAYVLVQPFVYSGGSGAPVPPAGSLTAWCNAFAANAGPIWFLDKVEARSSGSEVGYCELARTDGNSSRSGWSVYAECPSPPVPPGSFVRSLGACYVTQACPSGQTEDAQGVCQVTCPAAGTSMGVGGCAAGAPVGSAGCLVRAGTVIGLGVCSGGCGARGQMGGQTSDGAGYVWGPFVATGERCTGGAGGTPPSASPPPLACPAPQCPGTVNGNAVCVACGSTQAPGPVTSTTGSETGASGTTTSTGTSSSSTTCTGGTCTTTTTTTTTGSNGTSSQQQTTTTEPRTSFCESNPANPQCAGEDPDGSAFGGTCAGFSCDGDAIQCAIAQEQHRRNCALFDTSTPLSQKGVEASSGTDPSDHPRLNSQTVDFSLAAMIDASPLFGTSGSCPADVGVSVLGHSISLPFSRMCPFLTMAGAAFMMLCYFVAALIVFRRD